MSAWYAIRVVALAGGLVDAADAPLIGAFVASFDADAFDGRGAATWTSDAAKALTFGSQRDAYDFWRQESKVKPLREDGKINRPLTAYTVEIIPLVPR